jgi:lipopolysaccharide transport system ATP-binding protein
MKMRLAFAVATNIDPDILLIDEVLYVGDLAFQSKCLERIQQFKRNWCIVLLVTHDTQQIEELCDSAIWLKNGKICGQGTPQEIIHAQAEELAHETQGKTDLHQSGGSSNDDKSLRLNENRFGSLEVEITGVRLVDSSGIQIKEYSTGNPLRIEIDYKSHMSVVDPIFGVTVKNIKDQICCEMIDVKDRPHLLDEQQHGTMVLEIERLDLKGGEYYINIWIYEQNWEYAYDWQVYPLRVNPTASFKGILFPPHKWSCLGHS